MVNLSTLLVQALWLAAQVTAIRIQYVARHEGFPGRTSKLAGELDDDVGQRIIDEIGQWSGGRYEAAENRHGGMMTVRPAGNGVAASKAEATGLIEDMQRVVNGNIGGRGK